MPHSFPRVPNWKDNKTVLGPDPLHHVSGSISLSARQAFMACQDGCLLPWRDPQSSSRPGSRESCEPLRRSWWRWPVLSGATKAGLWGGCHHIPRGTGSHDPWHVVQMLEGTGVSTGRGGIRYCTLVGTTGMGKDTPRGMLHQCSSGLSPSHAGAAAFPPQAGRGNRAVALIWASVLQEDVNALLAS